MKARADTETLRPLFARVDRLREPDPPADPELAELLLATADSAAISQAGRLLAGVPAELLVRRDRPRRLRVAVGATFTADNVPPMLRVGLLAAGIDPVFHLVGAGQVVGELADPDSALARFRPDVTLCLLDEDAFLPRRWTPTDLAGLREAVADRVDALSRAVTGFVDRAGGIVLLHTVPLPAVDRRTVVSYRARARLGSLWRELNCRLLELPQRHPQVHTVDFEAELATAAVALRDPRLHRFAAMAWSADAELVCARLAARFCRAVAGLASKCLVLDLDGTLWGGVVGDDGMTGIQLGGGYPGNCHAEVQRRVAALREQGVLLAVCSRNEPSIVEQVFAEHPAMELRAADIVAYEVGWDPKDDGLRRVAARLGIGAEALVFVDDTRVECELVRAVLPQTAVVHLAGDPAEHAGRLLEAGHFDVLDTTDADRGRTARYQARAERDAAAESFRSRAEFLRELDVRVLVRPVDDYLLAMLVQLARRTNQFTMVAAPPSEGRTRLMAASADHLVLGFEVSDRFGADGLVGGVWLARRPGHWFIENFVLSCRVFSRGIEFAVLQDVVDRARAAGATELRARCEPTGRNRPAVQFYPSAGFAAVDTGPIVHFGLPLDPRPALAPAWIALRSEPSHA